MVSWTQTTQCCAKQKFFRNRTRRVAPRNEETLDGEKKETPFPGRGFGGWLILNGTGINRNPDPPNSLLDSKPVGQATNRFTQADAQKKKALTKTGQSLLPFHFPT